MPSILPIKVDSENLAEGTSGREDHPFARFLRIIGRGPSLSRPLDEAEAEEAMTMVLDGRVEPAQLGALFLVLRLRAETPEELVGFVRAARAGLPAPAKRSADLDWPSYADRHKQLPYFLLAALLLAENGIRVAMHGISGEGPVSTPRVLSALGVAADRDIDSATRNLERANFCYLAIERFAPTLAGLFDLRPVLGVRSPANSFMRQLNPMAAPAQMQGVFHPTYVPVHQETARRLGQPRTAIFKGGGGEVQRNPEKPCRVGMVADDVPSERVWDPMTPDGRFDWRGEALDPAGVVGLWRGERKAAAPEAAIAGTVAIALNLLDSTVTPDAALARARDMWNARPRTKYGR